MKTGLSINLGSFFVFFEKNYNAYVIIEYMDPSYNNPPSNPVAPNGANSGGVFDGGNNGQMNHDSGDIILQADGKKPKNGVIIGLVIGFVVVVVAVSVFLLVGMPKGKSVPDQDGKNTTVRNYQEAFNVYANYYLFGEEGEKDTVEWGLTKVSAFQPAYDESLELVGEEDNDMTSQLVLYFNTFEEFYSDLSNKTDYLTGLVENNSSTLAFLDAYYGNGITTRTEMIEKYASEGESAVIQMINGKANAYEDTDSGTGDDVKALVYELGNDQLGIIKQYDENGCLIDGVVDYGCASKIENDQKRQLFDRISIIEDKIINIVEKARKDLRMNVFEIGDSLDSLSSDKEDS